MFLNFGKFDKHGMLIITFDASLRENEEKLREDGVRKGDEMPEAAGCTNIHSYNDPTTPGACIQEIESTRLRLSTKTSVFEQMEPNP